MPAESKEKMMGKRKRSPEYSGDEDEDEDESDDGSSSSVSRGLGMLWSRVERIELT